MLHLHATCPCTNYTVLTRCHSHHQILNFLCNSLCYLYLYPQGLCKAATNFNICSLEIVKVPLSLPDFNTTFPLINIKWINFSQCTRYCQSMITEEQYLVFQSAKVLFSTFILLSVSQHLRKIMLLRKTLTFFGVNL